MQRSNSLTAAWGRLLGLLGLVMLVGACSTNLTGIGVGLPDANTNTGAYLVDTITVRASTVLRDSVPTSTSSYLLAGRYTDPLLGTLEARSFFRVGLTTTFVPDASYLLDSVVLVLKPDTYRYGDTTKTQTIFSVYRMNTPVSNTQLSYASPKYTKADFDSTNLLNEQAAPVRRARPNLTTLRIRLKKSFGQQLFNAGLGGSIATQDLFQNFLPGLAVLPGASDDAALVRMSATNSDAGLLLYYHTALDPSAQSISFPIAQGGGHFFQVRANRKTGALGAALPTKTLTGVSASLTGEQTFVEGALGLQTKLEFPYLTSIRQFGQNLTITSAQLTAQVPNTSLTPYLPTPPPLTVYLSNINNQPFSTTPYVSSVSYTSGVSTLTGLDQGTYSWSITSYVQAVLSNTTPNNGMLLASSTPDLPTRVVLGSQRSVLNKLQLRLYLISLN